MNKNTKIYIGLGILVCILLVSLLAYALTPAKFVKRIFFFPETLTGKVKSISRYIPSGINKEDHVKEYVLELALGPHKYNFSSILPKNGKVASVIYRDHAVYINFTRELAFNETSINPEETFQLLQRNIIYNFPNVTSIYCSIDGYNVYQTDKATE